MGREDCVGLTLTVGRWVIVGVDEGVAEGTREIVGTGVVVGDMEYVGVELGAGLGAVVSVG